MAKKTAKESKSSPAIKRTPMNAETKVLIKKIATHALCAVAFVGACGGAFRVSQNYVTKISRSPNPPMVVMKDQPAWMSPVLADQILDTVRPFTPFASDDHQMLVDRETILKNNPWVKQVKSIRRAYSEGPGDTIEIDCVFRAPVALMKWQEAYWYVDSDGVRLPEKLTTEQVVMLTKPGQPLMFHVIDGIAPIARGQKWPGDDLKAGIELVGLLADKPYNDQIIKIDVSNFAGRVNPNESQLNLITRYGTEVRWGQAPSSKAFFVEQNVNKKLDYLSQAKKQTGRVDMNQQWIDLRFDNATIPDNRARVSTSQ